MYTNFDTLGTRSHHTTGGDSASCHRHISGANPANRPIDPAAVLGVLMKNYAFSS